MSSDLFQLMVQPRDCRIFKTHSLSSWMLIDSDPGGATAGGKTLVSSLNVVVSRRVGIWDAR